MISFILILLFEMVLVQPLHVQVSNSPEDVSKVLHLKDVFEKSLCKPKEQLVDVEQEHPGDRGHVYLPHCVTLQRCSGYCTDENLACHPSSERNITLQLLKGPSSAQFQLVELTFVEHLICGCRSQQKHRK